MLTLRPGSHILSHTDASQTSNLATVGGHIIRVDMTHFLQKQRMIDSVKCFRQNRKEGSNLLSKASTISIMLVVHQRLCNKSDLWGQERCLIIFLYLLAVFRRQTAELSVDCSEITFLSAQTGNHSSSSSRSLFLLSVPSVDLHDPNL